MQFVVLKVDDCNLNNKHSMDIYRIISVCFSKNWKNPGITTLILITISRCSLHGSDSPGVDWWHFYSPNTLPARIVLRILNTRRQSDLRSSLQYRLYTVVYHRFNANLSIWNLSSIFKIPNLLAKSVEL